MGSLFATVQRHTHNIGRAKKKSIDDKFRLFDWVARMDTIELSPCYFYAFELSPYILTRLLRTVLNTLPKFSRFVAKSMYLAYFCGLPFSNENDVVECFAGVLMAIKTVLQITF